MSNTRRCAVVTVVMVAVWAATAGAQVVREGVTDSRPCPWVMTSSVEQSGDLDVRVFAAKETTDILFTVLFPTQPSGDHVLTLKVFTPRGHLYRQIDAPVSPPSTREAGTRRLPGYPYPLEVLRPEPVGVEGRSYPAVQLPFPVAGSTIVSSSLYGTWRVELFVDGVEQTCVAPRSFEIVQ